jgi:hypothetical protein
LQVEKIGLCEIPLNGETPPPPPECLDASVTNSDGSYTASVPSGDTLILPDTTYNFIVNGVTTSLTIPTLKDEIINIVWQ